MEVRGIRGKDCEYVYGEVAKSIDLKFLRSTPGGGTWTGRETGGKWKEGAIRCLERINFIRRER